jgi:phosphatidylinositol alpha-1,6-mannosyltransferase
VGARCISVARLIRQKGVTTLLRAWRTVIDRAMRSGATRELIIVGDGPLRSRLERSVHKLRLSGSVRIVGAVPRAEVITHLQQAAVFALPVRTRLAGLNPEGLCLAAIEAAACGLPVIIGDSGGTAETIRDGETGFLVPSHDHRLLAARIDQLLDDRALARDMGKRGRSHVTQHFGSDVARATLRSALEL